MNHATTTTAIRLAQEFIERAQAAEQASDRSREDWERCVQHLDVPLKPSGKRTWYGGKQAAAARRASMDLTRALAEMRSTHYD